MAQGNKAQCDDIHVTQNGFWVEKVYFRNFRNHEELVVGFTGGVTVLTGENGRGKTNILEGILYLSILRSFRTGLMRDLVRLGESGFTLIGRLSSGVELKVEQTLQKRRLYVDNMTVSRSSDFIRQFRAIVFAPEDRLIVNGAAGYRRKFFDILLSLEEPGYLEQLQHYQSALQERNIALKKALIHPKCAAVARAFEPQLAENAVAIHAARTTYATRVANEVNRLLQDQSFQINYQPNYPDSIPDYLATLDKFRPRDQQRAYTSIGPHLDDFELLYHNKLLRNYGSAGQVRLIALYLKMAELVIANTTPKHTIALVDDVTGELDSHNQARFFQAIQSANQAIFTFTSFPPSPFFTSAQELKI